MSPDKIQIISEVINRPVNKSTVYSKIWRVNM